MTNPADADIRKYHYESLGLRPDQQAMKGGSVVLQTNRSTGHRTVALGGVSKEERRKEERKKVEAFKLAVSAAAVVAAL